MSERSKRGQEADHLDFKRVKQEDNFNQFNQFLDDISTDLRDPYFYLDEYFFDFQRRVDLLFFVHLNLDNNPDFQPVYEEVNEFVKKIRANAIQNWIYFGDLFDMMITKYLRKNVSFDEIEIKTDRDKIRNAIINVSMFLSLQDQEIRNLSIEDIREDFAYWWNFVTFSTSKKISTIDDVIFTSLCLKDRDESVKIETMFETLEKVKLPHNKTSLKFFCNYETADQTIEGIEGDNLDIFEMHGVKLKSLDFPLIFPRLKRLVIFNSNFSSIKPSFFDNCQKLEIIKINSINLKTLDKNVFSKLTRLKKLIVYDSKIAYVDKDLFKNLGKLEELDLSNNELLETLPDLNYSPIRVLNVSFTRITHVPFFDVRGFSILVEQSKNLNLDNFRDFYDIRIKKMYATNRYVLTRKSRTSKQK